MSAFSQGGTSGGAGGGDSQVELLRQVLAEIQKTNRLLEEQKQADLQREVTQPLAIAQALREAARG